MCNDRSFETWFLPTDLSRVTIEATWPISAADPGAVEFGANYTHREEYTDADSLGKRAIKLVSLGQQVRLCRVIPKRLRTMEKA